MELTSTSKGLDPLRRIVWLLILPGIVSLAGCGGNSAEVKTEPPLEVARVETEIGQFCGACHATPRPDLFEADAWVREVQRGYSLFAESGRTDLTPPKLHEVVEYYRTKAPVELEFASIEKIDRGQREFELTEVFPFDDRQQRFPAISACRFKQSPTPTLTYGDMRSGEILQATWENGEATTVAIGQVQNPAGLFEADVDGDGNQDWVVADLGNFLPAMDHDKGSVAWLRNLGPGNGYEKQIVASGLGRVADVRVADFDNDQKNDLIVAEFGWHATGRVLLLHQIENEDGTIGFEQIVIDNRHGAIHVPIVDANGDGKMDFVCLFSQEYESVELFLNLGDNRFKRTVLHEAGAPSWGSSGIELYDLDQDNDLDVIWTNGDAFDSTDLRPYHQVQWLENQGDWQMEHHTIYQMPGVHRALPADLDQDGDLDLVAVALLPDQVANVPDAPLTAVVWLEQTSPGQFAPHRIRDLPCHHAALALGDVNDDGLPDIITGEFQFEESGDRKPDLSIWLNPFEANGITSR